MENASIAGKSDHLMPDCRRPAHHTCSACGKKGHVRPACNRATANNTTSTRGEEDEQQTPRMSAMTINNPLQEQQQLQHGSAQAVHSLYTNAATSPVPFRISSVARLPYLPYAFTLA